MGFSPVRNPQASAESAFPNEYDATFDPLTLWSDFPSAEDDPPATPSRTPGTWRPVTAHLGLRFDTDFKGPGLKVRDVVARGPTSQASSLVKAGEVVLAIDGTAVDPAFDLTQVLNGQTSRDVRLSVRDDQGTTRDVIVRPTTYTTISGLLYDKWVEDTRQQVEELSDGQLGYLHIRAMNASSLVKFDEDLYFAGAGKDGLIIDVRENGGGSTADYILTALTQPVHAITLSRAGGIGYPQDRKVYASWHKPIVVLCNQNSFSNAEILSHAVQVLKRGKLVGVPTAGGVISTGSTRILDLGSLRTPGRGWYGIESGEDMELHGAVPDVILWPEPGQMPRGEDIQLRKAIEVLKADVKAAHAKPLPKLIKASERGQ